ncbi:MAG: hypothetical protein ACXVEJ_08255, partial [Nocardioides sp.]
MTHLRPSSLLRAATAACLATGLAGGLAAGLTFGPSAGAATTGSGSSVGTASVFEVNPVQSSGDESLTDQKDSATAVPL